MKMAGNTINMNGEQSSAFSTLVHQILVKEKRYPVREIAAQLGMAYPTFYSRVSGRGTFSPEEINRLLRLVPDIRLVDWLLVNSGFIALARLDGTDPDLSRSAMEHAVRSVEQGLALMKELSEAATAGNVDKHRRERLEKHIEEMQRSIATLNLVLPYLSANPTRIHERLAAT